MAQENPNGLQWGNVVRDEKTKQIGVVVHAESEGLMVVAPGANSHVGPWNTDDLRPWHVVTVLGDKEEVVGPHRVAVSIEGIANLESIAKTLEKTWGGTNTSPTAVLLKRIGQAVLRKLKEERESALTVERMKILQELVAEFGRTGALQHLEKIGEGLDVIGEDQDSPLTHDIFQSYVQSLEIKVSAPNPWMTA